MDETVHIVPVGFDFQRLAQPITQGELEANRIHLLDAKDSEDSQAEELAARMTDRLEETLGTLFGKEIERTTLDNIFEFEEVYPRTYEMIEEEIEAGNDVWVNISSMPRTVAFAFASAANTLIVENPELRDRIHTYYVSPDEYLVIRMIEALREEKSFLEDLKEQDIEKAEERYAEIDELVSEIDSNGVTKGARKMNGGFHVKLPTVPSADLHEFEETVLCFIYDIDKTESTTQLARELAGHLEKEADQSFQSKVQYNVQRLEEKGFVNRTKVKNRTETELTTMGKLWVKTHDKGKQDKITA